MVVVERVARLSDMRTQTVSAAFPADALGEIRLAVEAVSQAVFTDAPPGTEVWAFDAAIADALPSYAYVGARGDGVNPACQLWAHQGFNHSVDLYDAEARIAIEVEKSERKTISDDLLKFQRGYRTQQDGGPVITFGCLIVPVNYRGTDNLFQHSLTTLEFIKGLLFIDDIAVIGYRDPRPD